MEETRPAPAPAVIEWNSRGMEKEMEVPGMGIRRGLEGGEGGDMADDGRRAGVREEVASEVPSRDTGAIVL